MFIRLSPAHFVLHQDTPLDQGPWGGLGTDFDVAKLALTR